MRTCATTLVSLLAFVTVTAGPATAQKHDVDESTVCPTTQTSGSGEKFFQTCVTETGNVLLFKSPQSASDSMFAEGYVVCDAQSGGPFSGRAWSTGQRDTNFSFPTTHTATSNVRTTTDGRYKLSQAFVRDVAEKQIVITMTLKNQGPGQVTDVRLARYFDGDINGGVPGDIYLRSTDSVIAVNGPAGRGLVLGTLTPEISHTTEVQSGIDFDGFDYDDCNVETGQATPTAFGDWAGRITFFLGTIAAGASKVVKVYYRRL